MPLADLQKALAVLVVKQACKKGGLAPAIACKTAELPVIGRRLSQFVRTPRLSEEWFGGLDLTAEEKRWLQQLTASPGLAVTCYIQRWWRETRLRWTARLTLALLGRERSAEVIDAYLNAVPPASLFFTPETLEFLDFVLDASVGVPHLKAIARFERALLLAAEASSFAAETTGPARTTSPASLPSPPPTIVEFAAPPEVLLGAILFARPLPEPSGQPYLVLVAADLPELWRSITPDAAHALDPERLPA
jgi:hypothetical protein